MNLLPPGSIFRNGIYITPLELLDEAIATEKKTKRIRRLLRKRGL